MNSDKIIDEAFNAINHVRSNPEQYVHTYGNALDSYNGKIFRDRVKTREGDHALRDLLNDLRTRSPVERKLQWCFGLHMVADQQARRLAEHNLVTTEGHECHQSLPQRVKDYAIVKGKISEVTEFGG